eukprot:GHVR01086970.1.p1 GENE.GHVR01086970.1~~GHVR01086970.1.p1  ORF type:complete len:251 (+),score=113.30 GHVR01086970.1:115-867(+)
MKSQVINKNELYLTRNDIMTICGDTYDINGPYTFNITTDSGNIIEYKLDPIIFKQKYSFNDNKDDILLSASQHVKLVREDTQSAVSSNEDKGNINNQLYENNINNNRNEYEFSDVQFMELFYKLTGRQYDINGDREFKLPKNNINKNNNDKNINNDNKNTNDNDKNDLVCRFDILPKSAVTSKNRRNKKHTANKNSGSKNTTKILTTTTDYRKFDDENLPLMPKGRIHTHTHTHTHTHFTHLEIHYKYSI